MDEHGLPIVGAGVDYTKVPPLEHRSTLVLINQFIVHTTKFLNRFSSVCEERLSDLCMRLQRLDISLSILESKLASIEGLDGVQATTQYEPPAGVAAAGTSGNTTSQPTSSSTAAAPNKQQAASAAAAPPPPGDSNEPIPPPQPQAEEQPQVMKIKDDPLYKPYFKMKRLGVNPLQVAMEMKRKGLNPDLLEDEDAPSPSGAVASSNKPDAGYSKGGSSDSSDNSSSSDEDDDDSFDSD